MACLDTSTLIDLSGRSGAKTRRQARSKLEELQRLGEDFVTTRLNLAELWVGVARASDPAAEEQKVAALLMPLLILEFDDRAARVFGHVCGELQRKGKPIGDMDALIGSICLVHGHGIVTRNVRHFTAIPGLIVEGY